MKRRTRGIVILLISFLVLTAAKAKADIYAYRDSSGVLHFTNVPPDDRYKLFLKTPERTKIGPQADTKEVESLLKEASMRYNLPYPLLKAIVRAESNFNPKAVSPKGAMGLMQLMPDTAKDMYVKDPFCPRENILGGAKYLRYLLDRFNGDLKLALAAYNAGPERVLSSGGIPNIPETVEFVQRVLRFYMADR
jgi:soluble lytic murein transglycosylase